MHHLSFCLYLIFPSFLFLFAHLLKFFCVFLLDTCSFTSLDSLCPLISFTFLLSSFPIILFYLIHLFPYYSLLYHYILFPGILAKFLIFFAIFFIRCFTVTGSLSHWILYPFSRTFSFLPYFLSVPLFIVLSLSSSGKISLESLSLPLISLISQLLWILLIPFLYFCTFFIFFY